jgi:cyclopropane-fatty-acyl-phospholipid synthase
MFAALVDVAERGWVPETLLRWGIRALLVQRLWEQRRSECEPGADDPRAGFSRFLQELASSPIALVPEKANEQHYELPAEFFTRVLGPRMKYSCCYWPPGVTSLATAEEKMLELTALRADIRNGQRVLDLGCGWGSFSLWLAERYPQVDVVAVSNSRGQREYIEERARSIGLPNLTVQTADVNEFVPEGTFDRVVSVEMFEHVRNHAELMRRIAGWLRPGGKLFVHIFVHRHYAYPYTTEGETNWMGKYFFTGGLMPSDDLLLRHQRHLVLAQHWRLDGRHYQRTARAWRERLEAQRGVVLPVLAEVYGRGTEDRWFQRWRLFFLACEELFGFRNGKEWWVSHYLFEQRPS